MLYNNHVIKEHRELPVYTGTAVLSTSPNSSFVSIKLFLVVVEVCEEVSVVVVLSLNLREEGWQCFR